MEMVRVPSRFLAFWATLLGLFIVPIQIATETVGFLRNGSWAHLDWFDYSGADRETFSPFGDWAGANHLVREMLDTWVSLGMCIISMTVGLVSGAIGGDEEDKTT